MDRFATIEERGIWGVYSKPNIPCYFLFNPKKAGGVNLTPPSPLWVFQKLVFLGFFDISLLQRN